jgi:hypothetical protein
VGLIHIEGIVPAAHHVAEPYECRSGCNTHYSIQSVGLIHTNRIYLQQRAARVEHVVADGGGPDVVLRLEPGGAA